MSTSFAITIDSNDGINMTMDMNFNIKSTISINTIINKHAQRHEHEYEDKRKHGI